MQTQICKFNVRDTVKQRQKGEKNGRSISRQANTEIYSKEYGYPEEEIQKRVERILLTRYFMGMMMNVFIMKPVMIWRYMEDTGNHDVTHRGNVIWHDGLRTAG